MGRLCVTWGAVGCVGGLGMDDLTGGALEALFFVVFDLSETCAGRQCFYSVSSDLLPLLTREKQLGK